MSHKSITAALRHIRRLCTGATTSNTTSTISTTISISRAKSQLRSEFDPDKALEIYSSLSKNYSSPVTSRYALDLTIRRLTKSHRFSDIVNLIESQKTDPKIVHEPFLSTLIRSYGLSRMFDRALQTYHQMDSFGTPRTSISFNALLSACTNSGFFGKVPQLFDEIPKQYGIVPDKISYGILAKSFCDVGNPEKALAVLKEVESKGVEITVVTYTTILDALYRKGNINEAERLWKLMENKGCLDFTAYNVKLKFMSGGMPENIKAVIDEMGEAGLVPDTMTYNILLTCYFKCRMLEEAKGVYAGLLEKGCRTNTATFRTLVFYLCRNEDYEGAYSVFQESAKVNKIPDFNTMKVLVEGLVQKGKKEEARELIRTVKMKFPRNVLNAWVKLEENLNLASTSGADSGDVEPKE